MTVSFTNNLFLILRREEGHFYLLTHIFHEKSPNKGRPLNLILDTGAYITVLSRRTAILCGYNKLPLKTITLNGFGGNGEPADVVRIPGLRLLDKLVTDVPVIPNTKAQTKRKPTRR